MQGHIQVAIVKVLERDGQDHNENLKKKMGRKRSVS